jgi:hypothetical protein
MSDAEADIIQANRRLIKAIRGIHADLPHDAQQDKHIIATMDDCDRIERSATKPHRQNHYLDNEKLWGIWHTLGDTLLDRYLP